jgi:hypothetical protein
VSFLSPYRPPKGRESLSDYSRALYGVDEAMKSLPPLDREGNEFIRSFGGPVDGTQAIMNFEGKNRVYILSSTEEDDSSQVSPSDFASASSGSGGKPSIEPSDPLAVLFANLMKWFS